MNGDKSHLRSRSAASVFGSIAYNSRNHRAFLQRHSQPTALTRHGEECATWMGLSETFLGQQYTGNNVCGELRQERHGTQSTECV